MNYFNRKIREPGILYTHPNGTRIDNIYMLIVVDQAAYHEYQWLNINYKTQTVTLQ